MAASKKKFAVIGLGNFGFHAARALFEEGNDVIAIDNDRNRVQAIDEYASEAILLDATDKDALHALALDERDSVIVSTGSLISNSILICLYLKEMGVKHVIAKALDADHAKILKKVGADEIVHPEKDSAERVAKKLSRPNMLDFVPLTEDYDLIQIAPLDIFIGSSLKQLNLRAKYNIHVLAIKQLIPENFILAPPADFVIKDSDILIILGKASDLKKLQELK